MVEPAQLGLHFYVVTSGTIIRAVCWREGQRTVTMDTTTVRPRCSASLSLYLPSDFDRGFENVQCKVTNPPPWGAHSGYVRCAQVAHKWPITICGAARLPTGRPLPAPSRTTGSESPPPFIVWSPRVLHPFQRQLGIG